MGNFPDKRLGWSHDPKKENLFPLNQDTCPIHTTSPLMMDDHPPGLQMGYRTLHSFIEKCPDFSPENPRPLTEVLVGCISDILVNPTQPLPEHIPFELSGCLSEIKDMHNEVQYCIWGMKISTAIWQLLISRANINARETVSQQVGYILAASHTQEDGLSLVKEVFEDKIFHFCTLEEVLDRVVRCSSCVYMSTTACYIIDMALACKESGGIGIFEVIEKMYPEEDVCMGRTFLERLAIISIHVLRMAEEHNTPHLQAQYQGILHSF